MFQFTHSGRGTTPKRGHVRGQKLGFNSRTLGRVRRQREEICDDSFLFQFTHPGKGATEEIDTSLELHL